jgi:hypothetical protein
VDVTARGAVDVHGYPDCGGVSAGSPGRRAGRRRLRRIASPSPTSERSASSLIVDSVLGVSGERHYRDVGIVTDRARLASRIEVEAGVQEKNAWSDDPIRRFRVRPRTARRWCDRWPVVARRTSQVAG